MKYDAIIVLGGGINSDGSLPKIVKSRVDKAVELYKKSQVPRIIMSGKWSVTAKIDFPRTEAEAMEEYAVSKGVKRDDILVEKESQDTLGNAYFTKIRFLKPAGWKKVIIVTTDFHVPRTQYLFKKVLGKDYKLAVVGAKNGLSKTKVKEAQALEKEKSAFFEAYLDTCAPLLDFDKE